jgi:hypothetical protein
MPIPYKSLLLSTSDHKNGITSSQPSQARSLANEAELIQNQPDWAVGEDSFVDHEAVPMAHEANLPAREDSFMTHPASFVID